jgi:DNA-binding transcriptional MocR family regulator
MRSLPYQALGYSDPAGLPTLRETLADYLGRVRGVSCEPDNIVVCNGFSHGLSVLARVLTERGIAVEDPGHPNWREQIDRHLRRTRRSYHQRRDTLIAALRHQLPAYRATGISAGLHVLVRPPDGTDATRLSTTAARHGILIHTLDRYRSNPTRGHHPALVMGYSRLTPHHIGAGIRHLAGILNTDVSTRPAG